MRLDFWEVIEELDAVCHRRIDPTDALVDASIIIRQGHQVEDGLVLDCEVSPVNGRMGFAGMSLRQDLAGACGNATFRLGAAARSGHQKCS